jgi:hypothetical protein
MVICQGVSFAANYATLRQDTTPGLDMLKWMTPVPKWRHRKRRRGRRKRLFLPFAFINDAFRRSRHPVAAFIRPARITLMEAYGALVCGVAGGWG